MKLPSRFFFISLLLLIGLSGCTTRVVEQPDRYTGPELTLDELISKVDRDIDVLKAIAEIDIKKDNDPYDIVKASVLLKKPDWLHMRMYKLGMLVRDFVIRGETIYVISGKKEEKLRKLGKELHNSIFWWDHLQGGMMHSNDNEYIVRTENRITHIDRGTLLPVRQEIRALDTNILVTYDNPVNNNGFWYPSLMKINLKNFTFTITLKKVLKNPALNDVDFMVPASS